MRAAVAGSWLLAAFAAGGQPAFAQGVGGSVAATAQVVGAGVIFGEAPLAFGAVLPGVAKAVSATSASAARFGGVFPPDSRLRLTLTLPAQLTSGGNTLAVGSWTALYSATSSAASAVAISTTRSTIIRVHPVTGEAHVFVGGTVTPTAAQPPGSYTGVITLTGNFAGF